MRKHRKCATFLDLGIRNHCSSLLRSHEGLGNSARSLKHYCKYKNRYYTFIVSGMRRHRKSNTLLDVGIRYPCSSLLRSHHGFGNSSRARFEAPMHQTSPLGLAYFSLDVAEAIARACLEAIMGSKTLLKLAPKHI